MTWLQRFKLSEESQLAGVQWAVFGCSAYFSAMFGLDYAENPNDANATALFFIACCFIWMLSWKYFVRFIRQKVWFMVGLAGAVMFVAASLDYMSTFGASSYRSAQNVTTAKFQNTKAADIRDSVDQTKTLIANINDEVAKIDKAAVWAPMTPASAWVAKAERAREGVRLESSDSRGGCGPKCDAWKTKLAEAEANLAVANRRVMLLAKRDDLLKTLEMVKKRSAETKPVVSAAAEQRRPITQLKEVIFGKPTLEPTDVSMAWTGLGINFIMSLGMWLIPGLLSGLREYISEPLSNPTAARASHSATPCAPPARSAPPLAENAAVGTTSHDNTPRTIVVQNDDDVWKLLAQLKGHGGPAYG